MVGVSDHIDYTISTADSSSVRYRAGHISYDIVHERMSRAYAAHIPQRRCLRLIDVAHRAHRPWLPLPHIACGRPIMQRTGSLGWGLQYGSRTSGGLNYACRKADCARPRSVKVVMISTLQRLSSVHSLSYPPAAAYVYYSWLNESV